MKMPKLEVTTRQEARRAVEEIQMQIGWLADFMDENKRQPRIYLGGNCPSLMLRVESCDSGNEWLALLKWIRSLKQGNGGLCVQLGNDHESRISTQIPADILNKMIETIESEETVNAY